MGVRAVRQTGLLTAAIAAPLWLTLAACGNPKSSIAAGARAAQPAVRYDQAVLAGGAVPAADSMHNPYAGEKKSAAEGQKLWSSMNCDGCHGGGEGWVGPSLSDGRWRYGGTDGDVYQTIYSGRPNGMPGFGGLLAPEIIWKLVSYIRSLPPPRAVPTQVW